MLQNFTAKIWGAYKVDWNLVAILQFLLPITFL